MKKGFLFKTIRVAIVIVTAVAIAGILIYFRPKPERSIPVKSGRLVDVIPAKSEETNMFIETYGTVKPREVLRITAEVRGRIVSIDSSFDEGEFVEMGAGLIKIDPETYALEVERQKVLLKQTKAELARLDQETINLQASLEIASSDLVLSKKELNRQKKLSKKKVVSQTTLDTTEQRYLSSRERLQGLKNQMALLGPAKESAKAHAEMSEVLLRQTELDLERTEIKAHFNGWVLEKKIEEGQYINAGEYLGSIYKGGGLDIEVRIPIKDLKWLPGEIRPGSEPKVEIKKSSGDWPDWTGKVTGMMASMDEKTRTLPVIVEVDEYPANDGTININRLRPGMFVTVKIKGCVIKNAFILPRHMVHPGDVVYLYENNLLKRKPVNIIRRYKEFIYIDRGLKGGDLIIKTPITGASDGMKVRL